MLGLMVRRLCGKCVLPRGNGANLHPDAIVGLMGALRYPLLHVAHRYPVYTQTCLTALRAIGFDPAIIAEWN